jgi:hypothetical protein
MQNLHIKDSLSLNILSNNEDYSSLEDSFKKEFSFESLNYFSFCKSGYCKGIDQQAGSFTGG